MEPWSFAPQFQRRGGDFEIDVKLLLQHATPQIIDNAATRASLELTQPTGQLKIRFRMSI